MAMTAGSRSPDPTDGAWRCAPSRAPWQVGPASESPASRPVPSAGLKASTTGTRPRAPGGAVCSGNSSDGCIRAGIAREATSTTVHAVICVRGLRTRRSARPSSHGNAERQAIAARRSRGESPNITASLAFAFRDRVGQGAHKPLVKHGIVGSCRPEPPDRSVAKQIDDPLDGLGRNLPQTKRCRT